MQKISLHTTPINGGPFKCFPAHAWEVEPERILCNDVRLPWEKQIRPLSLFVITNEFGAMGAVWAEHEQDALDELVDADLAGGITIQEDEESKEDEENPDVVRLGNEGTACDLTNCFVLPVQWETARDCRTLALFAEARGMGAATLGDDRLPL